MYSTLPNKQPGHLLKNEKNPTYTFFLPKKQKTPVSIIIFFLSNKSQKSSNFICLFGTSISTSIRKTRVWTVISVFGQTHLLSFFKLVCFIKM